MRHAYFFLLVAVLSGVALAQSSSPEALYERGMNAATGMGSTQSDQQALEFFRRSAELGYGPAELVLGYYYETGILLPSDPNQALEFYRKAAVQGDPLAAWIAARRYYLASRDVDSATKFLRPAAAQNNPFAAYLLGRIMAERDISKAPALYKIAADQGLPQAQYFYARALKDGRGIPQDRFNAYVWFVIALDAHYSQASTDLAQIRSGGYLTLAQINDAQARAQELEQVVIRAVNSRGCSGWDGEFDEMPTPPPPTFHPYCH